MEYDICKQFYCSEKLRITADDLKLFVRIIGKIDKIFDKCRQSVLAEHSFYHCQQRIYSIKFCIRRFDFPPRIEKVVGRKKRAVFIVCTIADNQKRIILEQLRDITLIADCKLGIGIRNGCFLTDSTLEFKNNKRQTIYKNNCIGYSFLIVNAFNFKLINYLKIIIFGGFKIKEADINILFASVLTVKDKAVTEELIKCLISFIYRAGNAFKTEDDTINFTVGNIEVLKLSISLDTITSKKRAVHRFRAGGKSSHRRRRLALGRF